MPNELEALAGELHTATLKGLLAKIQSGEATAADFNASIHFLKNNGVDVTRRSTGMQQLTKSIIDEMPAFEDDDTPIPFPKAK